MTLVFKDRVKETTSTTGTSDFTLTGAATGFRSFADIGNTNTVFYTAYDSVAGTWETGVGTYSTTGPTLARTTILSNSSGTTAKISFANTPAIWCDYPATKAVTLDASGVLSLATSISFTATSSAPTNGFYLNATNDVRVASNGVVLMAWANGLNNASNGVKVSFGGNTFNALETREGDGNNASFHFLCRNSAIAVIGSVQQNSSTSVAFNTTSDRRLKTDIVEITDGLTRLTQMRPVTFNRLGCMTPQAGFIADELMTPVPWAVTGEPNAVATEANSAYQVGDPIYQTVDYGLIVPVLTAALKETAAQLAALQAVARANGWNV